MTEKKKFNNKTRSICWKKFAILGMITLTMTVIAGCNNDKTDKVSEESQVSTEAVINDEVASSETTIATEEKLPEDTDAIKDTEESTESIPYTNNTGDSDEISEEATESSTEEIPENDIYEIPDVIKSLERGEYCYHIGADNLFYVNSQSKILDKGDYYEVPDAVFEFFDSTNTDPNEDYPITEKGFKPVNLRIRKGSKVLTDNYDYAESSGKYDEYKQYETDTEDLFSKDGKLINPYIGRDGSTFNCSDLTFDEEGYVTYFASVVGD